MHRLTKIIICLMLSATLGVGVLVAGPVQAQGSTSELRVLATRNQFPTISVDVSPRSRGVPVNGLTQVDFSVDEAHTGLSVIPNPNQNVITLVMFDQATGSDQDLMRTVVTDFFDSTYREGDVVLFVYRSSAGVSPTVRTLTSKADVTSAIGSITTSGSEFDSVLANDALRALQSAQASNPNMVSQTLLVGSLIFNRTTARSGTDVFSAENIPVYTIQAHRNRGESTNDFDGIATTTGGRFVQYTPARGYADKDGNTYAMSAVPAFQVAETGRTAYTVSWTPTTISNGPRSVQISVSGLSDSLSATVEYTPTWATPTVRIVDGDFSPARYYPEAGSGELMPKTEPVTIEVGFPDLPRRIHGAELIVSDGSGVALGTYTALNTTLDTQNRLVIDWNLEGFSDQDTTTAVSVRARVTDELGLEGESQIETGAVTVDKMPEGVLEPGVKIVVPTNLNQELSYESADSTTPTTTDTNFYLEVTLPDDVAPDITSVAVTITDQAASAPESFSPGFTFDDDGRLVVPWNLAPYIDEGKKHDLTVDVTVFPAYYDALSTGPIAASVSTAMRPEKPVWMMCNFFGVSDCALDDGYNMPTYGITIAVMLLAFIAYLSFTKRGQKFAAASGRRVTSAVRKATSVLAPGSMARRQTEAIGGVGGPAGQSRPSNVGHPQLRVIKGWSGAHVIRLPESGVFKVGAIKDAGMDFEIDVAQISSRHVAFNVQRGSVTMTDLGSRNGTTLNETRLVPNQPQTLKNGDRIVLGTMVELEFYAPKPTAPKPRRDTRARPVRRMTAAIFGGNRDGENAEQESGQGALVDGPSTLPTDRPGHLAGDDMRRTAAIDRPSNLADDPHRTSSRVFQEPEDDAAPSYDGGPYVSSRSNGDQPETPTRPADEVADEHLVRPNRSGPAARPADMQTDNRSIRTDRIDPVHSEPPPPKPKRFGPFNQGDEPKDSDPPI